MGSEMWWDRDRRLESELRATKETLAKANIEIDKLKLKLRKYEEDDND